ncbi:MAG: hypothetical protein JO040_00160 [Gemmatimonadetes bacterium]|nr:hypothetical protein [Gemmatimonadota bacterium]
MLNPDLTQEGATHAIAVALSELDNGEPLCFSAHGNNKMIGDDHWQWTYEDITRLLTEHTNGYSGPILIHACATEIVNFSAHLAVKLEKELERMLAFRGTCVYGYNRSVPIDTRFPRPDLLDRQVDLQVTCVTR